MLSKYSCSGNATNCSSQESWIFLREKLQKIMQKIWKMYTDLRLYRVQFLFHNNKMSTIDLPPIGSEDCMYKNKSLQPSKAHLCSCCIFIVSPLLDYQQNFLLRQTNIMFRESLFSIISF